MTKTKKKVKEQVFTINVSKETHALITSYAKKRDCSIGRAADILVGMAKNRRKAVKNYAVKRKEKKAAMKAKLEQMRVADEKELLGESEASSSSEAA